jgi:hypothetical protein
MMMTMKKTITTASTRARTTIMMRMRITTMMRTSEDDFYEYYTYR